jgi:hypothetical protein
MGINGNPLDMIIDRRKYKGFSAVYGQQLGETGQIIACASPAVEPMEAGKNLKINSKEFLEISAEIFVDWFPKLSSVGFQAIWAGYYTEPRYARARFYVKPVPGKSLCGQTKRETRSGVFSPLEI